MNITQRACMFAHYSKATDKSNNDVLLVKERICDENGVERPNIRYIYDFKKPFWITKKGARDHETKKEYEVLENLIPLSSTQARLPTSVARALGEKTGGYKSLRELSNSPYLYGTDIPTESIVKHQYRKKYETYAPEATVAALDLETNVHSREEEIISGSVTFKDRVIFAVTEKFIGTTPDYKNRIEEAFDKYLGEYKTSRKIKLHVKVVKNDLGVVKALFAALHKWQPDIVSIWNMAFDINKILGCLKNHDIDPKYIFSHPSLPTQYKNFNWREDLPQKTTATGKVTSKHFADLWHVLEAPASFYFVDAMTFFKRNRPMEAARHSYSLDAILKEELDLTKLKFKEADAYSGLEWHLFMQANYKVEYGIYNIFDCIALELLDEKTNDLSRALIASAGLSPIKDIASGPRNLANNLHFFLLDKGKVICSTSPNMREEMDSECLSMKNWMNFTSPYPVMDIEQCN